VTLGWFDPNLDPNVNALLCTALDDGTADKRMNSASMDFYELSCIACSNLKIHFCVAHELP